MQPAVDFRGYLAQNSPSYLAFTGNDARIDPSKGGYDTATASYANSAGNRNTVQNEVNALYAKYQSSQNPTSGPNLLGGGGSYATPPPNWDLTSIYNQAGAGAAAQVNPYYTLQLQKFQADQANAKAIQQRQQDLGAENLNNTLQNNLQSNQISRGRDSADALLNEQQIGQTADYRQQDQGQAFDQQRIAEAKAQANAGLTGSGLGNQQTLASQTAHTTQEQRQGEADHQAVAAQELSKARNFEDLANSDTLSKLSNAQGNKQLSIDWDKFVQGQDSALNTQQDTLERARIAQLSQTQRQLAQQQVNSMITSLSNPLQRQAATSAYARAF